MILRHVLAQVRAQAGGGPLLSARVVLAAPDWQLNCWQCACRCSWPFARRLGAGGLRGYAS